MPKEYIVKEKDTLYGIIQRECPGKSLQVTARQIAKRNGLKNLNRIYIGQTLILECAAGEAPFPLTESIDYTVKPGDTLTGIAARFQRQCPGLTWLTIAKDNAIEGPDYVINSGQQLTINCSTSGGVISRLDGTVLLEVPYYSQNSKDAITVLSIVARPVFEWCSRGIAFKRVRQTSRIPPSTLCGNQPACRPIA